LICKLEIPITASIEGITFALVQVYDVALFQFLGDTLSLKIFSDRCLSIFMPPSPVAFNNNSRCTISFSDFHLFLLRALQIRSNVIGRAGQSIRAASGSRSLRH
jgi:hypothetical protein